MADERELLVAFAEWYGQAYAANFIPKGTIDAFLAARQPPSEPYPPRSEPIGPPSVAACAGCLNRATYCHACYHAPALDQWLAARQPPGCTCTVIDELGSHEATCPEGFPPPVRQDGPRERFMEFAAKFADWPTGLLATSTARFCRWCGNAASACACTRAPDPRRDKWWVKEHAALGRVVAYECMARRDGLMSFPLAPPRDTLALSEDDGRASGLPEWEG